VSYISEAHADWHTVNGAYNSMCPLDCGAMSPEAREAEDLMEAIAYADSEGEARIKCAHCKDRHVTVDAVRMCGALHGVPLPADAPPQPVAADTFPDPWKPQHPHQEPPF
jgi:hypothetical protein